MAVIRHEKTDRVSIDAVEVKNLDILAKYLQMDETQAYLHLGIEGRVVAPPYTGPQRMSPDGKPGSDWGSAAVLEYGTSSEYPFTLDSTLMDVEHYAWPDPKDYDYAAMVAAAVSYHENFAVRGPYWRPIFCTICSLLGMENTLIAMAEGSKVFEAMLERVAYVNFEYSKRMIDAAGDSLDIYCLGDDFGTQRGLLLSPTLWRKYLKPIYKKIFSYAKDNGKPVWFHSCGDVTSVLPDLLDIGMDVWETVQLHTLPMTAEELKNRFGNNITYFGGINTQNLPYTTAQAVREEVKHCINVLGKNGGYICGPDHQINPEISAEVTLALFDTAKAHRYE